MSIADNFWCAAINDSHNKQKSLNEPFLFLFLLSFPDRIYVFTSTRWIEKFYVAIVFLCVCCSSKHRCVQSQTQHQHKSQLPNSKREITGMEVVFSVSIPSATRCQPAVMCTRNIFCVIRKKIISRFGCYYSIHTALRESSFAHRCKDNSINYSHLIRTYFRA